MSIKSQNAAGYPLVSVVCIAYNQCKYIRDALNGFLLQVTDFEIEVIVHDDASTDGTSDVLRAYQHEHPELFKLIIQKENQYRKIGFGFVDDVFKQARGRYIAICEGDDYWTDPAKLQKQVDALESNPGSTMCFHNAYRVNLFTGDRALFNASAIPSPVSIKDIVTRPWFSPTASFLIKKDLAFTPKVNNCNKDILFLFHNALHGKVIYIDEAMSVYRYGAEGSLSAAHSKNMLPIYGKKLSFLNYVDRATAFKYFVFTAYARLRLALSAFKCILLS